MPKKSLLKIFLLTPLAGLFLAGSAFLIADYPASVAAITSVDLFDNNAEQLPTIVQQELPKVQPQITQEQIKEIITSEIGKHLITSQPATLDSSTAIQMLTTTLKISRNSGGSGTGVPVFENKIDDKVYTYVVTNSHVVSDETEVKISKYHYLNNATIESTVVYPGRVILNEPDIDLALIEIQTNSSIGPMASFLSKDLKQRLTLTQHVFVASCPLGNPPLLTSGRVASIHDSMTTITAFCIFGSSGAGAYDINGNLVGIVSSIMKVQLDKNHVIPEPNITNIIPLPMVVSWLIVKEHGFIVDFGSHEDFILSRALSEIGPR